MPSMFDKEYTEPAGQSSYLKFKAGKTKFRIMDLGIVGYEYWTETDGKRAPKRVHSIDDVPPRYRAGKDAPKFFSAMVVWGYDAQRVQVLSLTQSSVRKALRALADSEDWGDPRNYDITVTRTGSTKDDTEYSVTPGKTGAMPAAIVAEAAKVDIDALMDGGDPFAKVAKAKKADEGDTGGGLEDDDLDGLGDITPKQVSAIIRASAVANIDDDALSAMCLKHGAKKGNLSKLPSAAFDMVMDEIKDAANQASA